MTMKYLISFPLEVFESSGNALAFLYPFIRVPILSIMSGKSFSGGYEDFRLDEAIAALHANKDKTFSISADAVEPDGEEIRMSFHEMPFQNTAYFVLTLEGEDNVDVPAFVAAAAAIGMSFAYKFDYKKAFWQSVELINTYETNKRPYAHLRRLDEPGTPPSLAKIDISENPGHQRLTYGMQLMAAPEMWFGPGCWKYFDQARVLSFPDAQEVRDLGGGLIYVRLFDWQTPDYEAGKILHLQERFRKWVGMDAVEVHLQELVRLRREELRRSGGR
jgi:hypothetical protein